MNQLNKFQNFLYGLGGILLLIGAAMPLLPGMLLPGANVFTIGVLFFAPMQMLARYEGKDITVRRLRRQQLIGALLLLVTAGLLLMKAYHVGPLRGDEWKLTLTIAAILEVYTAFRIPAALQEEQGNRPKE